MFNTTKKIAFTLSELLIAVAIIGVIAAITVPRVVTGMKTKADVLKLKRAYVELQDAITKGSAAQGYDMQTAIRSCNSIGSPGVTLDCKFFKDLLSVAFDAQIKETSYAARGKEIKFHEDIPANVFAENQYELLDYSSAVNIATENDLVYVSKNGIYYIFKVSLEPNGHSSRPGIVYIDINGEKGPNEIITCTEGDDTLASRTIALSSGTTDGYIEEPEPCTVEDNAVTDIYPFYVYNKSLVPATSAVMAVLEK